MAKKELTPEEKKNNKDFLELCSYIEKEILNYDNKQKLQKAAVLRIRGLSKGQVVANNTHEQYGEYPYEVILIAFKVYKNQIKNAISNKNFDSESKAIGYISAIVRDKLNDVYSRVINAKKSQEKIESINTEAITYQGAEYQSRNDNEKNNKKNKFEDLW